MASKEVEMAYFVPEILSMHPQDHDQNMVTVCQAVIVEGFSLDGGGRRSLPEKSGLQYRRMRVMRGLLDMDQGKVRLDLGVRRFVKPIPSIRDERQNNLLRDVMLNRDRFALDGELTSLHSDVWYMGVLTTLLFTHYERRDGWEVKVTIWRGNLLIMQVETEQKRTFRVEETKMQCTMPHMGEKSNLYMSSNVLGQKPDMHISVNENEVFHRLISTLVGGVCMQYRAEMVTYYATILQSDNMKPVMLWYMITSRKKEAEISNPYVMKIIPMGSGIVFFDKDDSGVPGDTVLITYMSDWQLVREHLGALSESCEKFAMTNLDEYRYVRNWL